MPVASARHPGVESELYVPVRHSELQHDSRTIAELIRILREHAQLEPASLDGFAQLYSFPRWLAAVRESLPEGTPLPNLADVIQEKCEQVLPQLCMPVQN